MPQINVVMQVVYKVSSHIYLPTLPNKPRVWNPWSCQHDSAVGLDFSSWQAAMGNQLLHQLYSLRRRYRQWTKHLLCWSRPFPEVWFFRCHVYLPQCVPRGLVKEKLDHGGLHCLRHGLLWQLWQQLASSVHPALWCCEADSHPTSWFWECLLGGLVYLCFQELRSYVSNITCKGSCSYYEHTPDRWEMGWRGERSACRSYKCMDARGRQEPWIGDLHAAASGIRLARFIGQWKHWKKMRMPAFP